MQELPRVFHTSLTQILGLSLGCGFLALLWLVVRYNPDPNDYPQAFLMGFFGSSLPLLSEIFFFERSFARIGFRSLVLIRPLQHLAIIVAVFTLISSFINQLSLKDAFLGLENVDLLFAWFVVMSINFVVVINRLLGPGSLWRFLSGAYRTPTQENRVFLFLDLKDSTAIAEEMGPEKFHRFIDRFFQDLADPVLQCRGEIYKYVGDEVIVHWKIRDGRVEGEPLRAPFLIQKVIQSSASKYQKEFGRIPEFKCGLHSGEVIAGEVGDYRREVAWLGDTVNTSARIQAACNEQNAFTLISENLRQLLQSSSPDSLKDLKFRPCGSIALKGKSAPMELMEVHL